MESQIADVFILGAAISIASLLISVGDIFSSMRSIIFERAKKMGAIGKFISNLIECPICISVWLSFFSVYLYKIQLLAGWYPIDFIVSSFAIVAVSSIFSGVICWSVEQISNFSEDE